MALNQSLPEQIAWGCRILGMYGHGDFTLGHVSARDGELVQMKCNGVGLEEVTPNDVVTIDLDCRKVAGAGPVHLESVLHTAVYQRRDDVGAVIHTHPPYTTAFGAAYCVLEMLNHDAVLFHDGLAYFDETAEMIVSPEKGDAVARSLGDCRAVILRGHGVLVTGKTVPWAVYTALTLERVIQIQSIAGSLGELRPMTAEMAKRIYPVKYRDVFVDTYWNYLMRQVKRAGLADGLTPLEQDDAGAV